MAQLSNLTKKVARGAGWMMGAKFAERALTLVKLVVLARILSPDDFGVFGIVVLAISTLEMLSHTGLRKALVQRADLSRDYLDTAWTALLVRALLEACILIAVSGPVAAFFDMPAAAPMLRAIGALALLRGLRNIGTVYFDRELRFAPRFVLDVGSAGVGLVVGIPMALWTRSAWALVFSSIAAEAGRTVLSYLLHPYRPSFAFVKKPALELLEYCKWMFGTSTIVFLTGNIDDAVVGRMLGATSLGFYQIGYKISHMPLTEFGNTLWKVLFPAYSKIQDDRERLRKAYLTVLENVMFVVLPVAAGITVYAPQIIRYTVGSQWMDAVPLVRILAPAAGLYILNSTTGAVYLGAGKTNYIFWKNMLRFGTLVLLIVPLARHFGNAGVCYTVLFSNAFALLAAFYFLRRITGVSMTQVASCLVPPATGAAILVLPTVLLSTFFETTHVVAASATAAGFVLLCAFVYKRKSDCVKDILEHFGLAP